MLAIYGEKSVSYAPLCVRAHCRLFWCLSHIKRDGIEDASGELHPMPFLEIASSGVLRRG